MCVIPQNGRHFSYQISGRGAVGGEWSRKVNHGIGEQYVLGFLKSSY